MNLAGETWTFIARKTGEASLEFSYRRSWQDGEKATWTLKLAVRVSLPQC